MNYFQRLNDVKKLKNFFFAQRTNTRKQASNRQPLPCDAMVPAVQNQAGARCPDWTRQRCAQQTRQRWAQQTSSYITTLPWPPGLIVGPCPSEESLCCPAIAPPPPLFADSRPPVSKVHDSFPCICSPPVCIIRSVTSPSLATTTCTPEHPFFSTHCYPNTYYPMTKVSLVEAPSRL